MAVSSFSNDGAAAISRRLSSPQTGRQTSRRDLRGYYEIERCVQFICSCDSFKQVALQFPDQLLCDSATIVSLLSRETGRDCYILGDTSYGSCCVDEVAASHVNADCIIHYGPSCLTQTQRLPVLYVFGCEEMNVEDCATAFRQLIPNNDSHVLVLYDTVYSHCAADLSQRLINYSHCVMSQLSLPHPITPHSSLTHTSPPPHTPNSKGTDTSCIAVSQSSEIPEDEEEENTVESKSCFHERFGRFFRLDGPVEQYSVFYVGCEGQALSNWMLNLNQSQFFSYDPCTGEGRRETVSVNKSLGRRYFLVQKAKEAQTVGILVGTLGAADHLKLIERLKKILSQAGKKYYTVAVGKLNAAKMANFMEIDIYVLVACPQNSLVESQEFYKPVVTPFEMEIACLRGREWTGQFVTDYQQLFSLPVEEEEDPGEEPQFSLLSGGLLQPHPPVAPTSAVGVGGGVMAVRTTMDVAIPNTAAAYLRGRSWQGLERRLGESEVEEVGEGRRGVASSYSHEQHHND